MLLRHLHGTFYHERYLVNYCLSMLGMWRAIRLFDRTKVSASLPETSGAAHL